MPKTRSLLYCAASLLARALPIVLFSISVPLAIAAGSPNIVISQVYGGGGNSAATLKNDFIEIFNRDGSTVNLNGWSVQYNSTAGTGTWQVTALSGSLAPGQYYLVQEAAGAGGTTNLPTPDKTGGIAMSATGGKVALVNTTTALSGSNPPTTNIVDLIGYDGANFFEGAATPTLSNTTAALRLGGGCIDTDNNSQDFSVGAPAPRNTSSPVNCGNVSGTGSAIPNPVPAGTQVVLTVTVTPGSNPTSTGITVTGNLSLIGGSANQSFSNNVSNGCSTGDANTF